IKYNSCIQRKTNKFSTQLDKISPVYHIGTFRYSNKECNSIIYVDINQSNLTNHYENAIQSNKIIPIFKRIHFSLMESIQ
ncbi:hypothetical protein H8356DRAFT_960241, partial [Neocallimastix lanati (nom. inval.)]